MRFYYDCNVTGARSISVEITTAQFPGRGMSGFFIFTGNHQSGATPDNMLEGMTPEEMAQMQELMKQMQKAQ